MNLQQNFKAARNRAVPLVAITTPDPAATVATLLPVVGEAPALAWDICQGLRPVNDAGQGVAEGILGDAAQAMSTNPVEALNAARRFPNRACLFMFSAHRIIEDAGVAQAVWLLRDAFKQVGSTLVLLAPAITLPAELAQDVIVFDEPLPDDEALGEIVGRVLEACKLPPLDAEAKGKTVAALRGLAAFPAEQVVAMSASKRGLDNGALWERKRATVEQTRGLSFDRGNPTFEQIGGLEAAKKFGAGLFRGPRPPSLIVRLDEIEKMLAGAGGDGRTGDSSGVSQDALGVILREMEDNSWAGMIATGPAGAGKSLFSRSLGETHGAPTVAFDLGAMKASFVGESEKAIRGAMKILKAIGDGDCFFVATCNRMTVLPPELRRRFRYGIWMFDLPTVEEREPIWELSLKRYGLKADAPRPADEGWTGAEIRNCAELAWRLGTTPAEAASMIVPVSKSDPDKIEEIRKAAEGRFLSASTPGTYTRKPVAGSKVRSMTMEG